MIIPEHAIIHFAPALDKVTANRTVAQMRCGCTEMTEKDQVYSEKPWRDARHIATTEVRLKCTHCLCGDDCDEPIALVDIRLTEELPNILMFHNLFDVNSVGLWYYNLISEEEGDTLRQRVIPWDYIESVTLHAVA